MCHPLILLRDDFLFDSKRTRLFFVICSRPTITTTMPLTPDLINFQPFLQLRRHKGKQQIYDEIRRQFVAFLPEELVRQLWVQYLLRGLQYPIGKIRVEYALQVHERQKRCDILVFDAQFQPWLIVECKASNIAIDRAVFEQVAIYNIALQVPYLVVSNGIESHVCRIDYDSRQPIFLEEMPGYNV